MKRDCQGESQSDLDLTFAENLTAPAKIKGLKQISADHEKTARQRFSCWQLVSSKRTVLQSSSMEEPLIKGGNQVPP